MEALEIFIAPPAVLPSLDSIPAKIRLRIFSKAHPPARNRTPSPIKLSERFILSQMSLK